MSWIKIIEPERASGKLKKIYDRVSSPGKRADNILQVHSLRPHTLEGHMALYKTVMHHSGNTLPQWFLETAGTYVSILNRCDYCTDHHFAGLTRLLKDHPGKAERIRKDLEKGVFTNLFSERERLLLGYARKLTLSPSAMAKKDIKRLQRHAIDDGEILEVNQVVAYFSYANRTVQGLGTTTQGDDLGLSPHTNEKTEDWRHY